MKGEVIGARETLATVKVQPLLPFSLLNNIDKYHITHCLDKNTTIILQYTNRFMMKLMTFD